jgi:hypothetical protein
VALLAGGLASLAPAQSVASVDDMEARYKQQPETVDTCIVETNLYTFYNRNLPMIKSGVSVFVPFGPVERYGAARGAGQGGAVEITGCSSPFRQPEPGGAVL